MLLGFKRRFAPFVRNGSKTHTIRAYGKRRPFRPGDICDCYVDPRQRTMKLLGRWPCVKVEEIEIKRSSYGLNVRIDGQSLTLDEVAAFFRRDGFRSRSRSHLAEAAAFWKSRLPFHGQIIHWKFTPKKRKRP